MTKDIFDHRHSTTSRRQFVAILPLVSGQKSLPVSLWPPASIRQTTRSRPGRVRRAPSRGLVGGWGSANTCTVSFVNDLNLGKYAKGNSSAKSPTESLVYCPRKRLALMQGNLPGSRRHLKGHTRALQGVFQGLAKDRRSHLPSKIPMTHSNPDSGLFPPKLKLPVVSASPPAEWASKGPRCLSARVCRPSIR